ncbi:PARVA [Bugula neritina]|uniref:PARVA n=1 Tax=Bugula neritina TaxID=10212 RepID=A0A7J7JQ53_BUGNE|nr:PARVA [Bugula neritina]
MASSSTPSPNSPPATLTSKKDKKDDTGLFERIGTFGRKKKAINKDAQDLADESQKFSEHSTATAPVVIDYEPDSYVLEENEERSMIEPQSKNDPKLKNIIQVLLDWINDELANHRIIVKDIQEDMYDGQVLQKLVEQLANLKIEVPEVTQSEIVQKQKLKVVLEVCIDIHSKNLVSILHLLVALVRHFRPPVRLPEYVSVNVVVVQKQGGILHSWKVSEEITGANDDIGARFERDAFDTLFDHAPDKLSVVKKSLITFVNKHLNKVNLEVTDLDRQFQDGVYMCMLMGLLEGFFIPLYSYHITPVTEEQKIHNVALAFELMDNAGLPKPKARAEDIVRGDLKSTLRVLYNLFTRYKNIS